MDRGRVLQPVTRATTVGPPREAGRKGGSAEAEASVGSPRGSWRPKRACLCYLTLAPVQAKRQRAGVEFSEKPASHSALRGLSDDGQRNLNQIPFLFASPTALLSRAA